MTAEQHLERAEQLLEQAQQADAGYELPARLGVALEAVGHAVAAVAIELGVPHPNAPIAGG